MGRHCFRMYSIELSVLFSILSALQGTSHLYFSMYVFLRFCRSPTKPLHVGGSWVGIKDRPLLSRERECVGSVLLERFATLSQGTITHTGSGWEAFGLTFADGGSRLPLLGVCWGVIPIGDAYMQRAVDINSFSTQVLRDSRRALLLRKDS